jgi:hypothetical protein
MINSLSNIDYEIFHFTLSKTIQLVKIDCNAKFLVNGDEVMNFLQNQVDIMSDLSDAFVLDINIPVVDGWAFMEEYVMMLKPRLKKPIIVKTVSALWI